jgi:hypothetical protein
MVARSKNRELEPPPMATTNARAVEILRVWAAPDGPQQVTLRTCWEEAGVWGLMLVDVARHAAQAYEREGRDPRQVLERIRQAFDAEWAFPTDAPKDLTDDPGGMA